MDEPHTDKPRSRLLRPRTFVLGACIIAAIALGAFWAVRLTSSDERPPALAQASQAFTVLYHTGNLPQGFSVDTKAVTYEGGVLFIPITAKDGRRIVVTEQPLPEKFKQSNGLVGAEKVTGADGPAVVSHAQGHATATMLSKDLKTLVFINDTSNVGTEAVKDLLRGLRPL